MSQVEPQCTQPNEVKHYEYRIREGVLDVIRQNIKENCPDVAFFIPEHHKWYQFGYGIMEA